MKLKLPEIFKKKKDLLDEEIETIRSLMIEAESPEEYAKQAMNLEILYRIKKDAKKGVSPDTKWLVLGNIFVTLAVLNYERADIIRTKVTGYLLKGRV